MKIIVNTSFVNDNTHYSQPNLFGLLRMCNPYKLIQKFICYPDNYYKFNFQVLQ